LPVQSRNDPQECLLEQVIGHIPVPHHTAQIPEDAFLVAFHQGAECRFVGGFHVPGYQYFVCWMHASVPDTRRLASGEDTYTDPIRVRFR